ncbi:phage portal protein [Polycladidibacter hongkongensis]|uniref:phage portal protein n=1 Tax=Polycladidibacter hongkongensis TaxID=1647556 RepID=UPI0009E82557|nr:phage portal protein [Pseudovibrio hongkongensis]
MEAKQAAPFSSAKFYKLATTGEPIWTNRDYAALARAGYCRNPVVYRAIRMIAEAAASLPLILKDGAIELDEHPLLSLLHRPHPGESKAGLLEAVYGHLLSSGNAYLHALTLQAEPRELHCLRPDRVSLVTGNRGWVEAWDYTLAGKTTRLQQRREDPLPPVLQLRLFAPLSDHYGFAPLEAAQTALDVHNAAAAWSKSLLDNAACPTGALVYGGPDSAQLSDEQFTRLKQELEGSYQGARNAGRPMLLEGGLDWKPMGLSPKDLDCIEIKNQAAREIALAFGVPPMLLGIPGDSTYSNYREANRAFWRQAVLPLVHKTLAALGNWLGSAYAGDLHLSPDLDAIEALSEERKSLWERVSRADFLTDDEKRLAVGYGMRPTQVKTTPPQAVLSQTPAAPNTVQQTKKESE